MRLDRHVSNCWEAHIRAAEGACSTRARCLCRPPTRCPGAALPTALPTACCLPAAKADRLKQAKEEAEREIAAFKAERETEFRSKVGGGFR